MVLSLSAHQPHGVEASPFARRTTSSSTGTSSPSTSKSMDSSSSHSFGAIGAAARFSKNLFAKRSVMSTGSRKDSDGMGDSHHVDQRRRESPILADPHKHLQSIITSESSPFLSPFMESPIPAPSMARNALQLGKLLQDGDFCRLQEVVGFKRRNPQQQRQESYTIKSINPSLLQPKVDDDNDEALERAATKLVLEGLYLGHLNHPHILKLRGVSMGGMAAEPEALFLLTDRLGDTLDRRVDMWKQWAAAKKKQEKRRQRREQYPPFAGPMSVSSNHHAETVLNDKTIQTYPEDLIVLKTNYALQILDALQYLHERGIVVRELRPESIGFCTFPNHHTVQLCDLSSAKEVPRDGSEIEPEAISERPTLLDASSSYHKGSDKEDLTQNSDTQSSHTEHSLLGVRTTLAARRYMAPELFGDEGYNTKADLYSWAMIFSELVTEAKPYSTRQLMRDWTKIVRGQLRPKLQKYHFPRTIKCLLEQAWQANVTRRATAKQISKSLTTVLHMLEGQGLPWLVDPETAKQQEAQKAAAELDAPSRRRSRMSRQKTLTRQSMTLAAQSSQSSSRCKFSGAPLTLPQRAVHYKRLQAKEPIGWGNVWNPRAGNQHEEREEGAGIQATVQSNKDQVFQKRYKANRIEGI